MLLAVKRLLHSRYKNNGRPHVELGPTREDARQSLIRALDQGEIRFLDMHSCPLCNGSDLNVISEKDRLGVPNRVAVCSKCDLVFNTSPLATTSSSIFYQKYWRKIQWGKDPEKNFRHRTKVESYAWKRYAFVVSTLKDVFKNFSVVMEPGCGDGCNLLPYHLSGKEVIGCDYDEESLVPGRREGMRLIKGNTKTLADTGIKADFVILSHVVEHFTDIDAEIEWIKQVLKKDGYVYVEVPGIRNMNQKRCNQQAEDGLRSTNDLLGYLQFLHNYHFELKTLLPFFTRNGFQCIYGDEWVRAIFRYSESTDSHVSSQESSKKPILEHLTDVEKDYQSLYNQFLIFGKKVVKRLKPAAI